MFNKKCPRCARKTERDFEFCPYCGYNIKKEKNDKDFGFLGKDDFSMPDFGRMPFGFNSLFSNLVKQIDSQFKQLDKEMTKDSMKEREIRRIPKFSQGISISISSGTGRNPEIQVRGFPASVIKKIKEEKPVKIEQPKFSEEKMRQLAKLPRQEAETKVRRLSNKIIYEISMPGVESMKNIIINKLENSIEIKAFSKEKVYIKLLPINLPILDYNLEDETLILEFAGR